MADRERPSTPICVAFLHMNQRHAGACRSFPPGAFRVQPCWKLNIRFDVPESWRRLAASRVWHPARSKTGRGGPRVLPSGHAFVPARVRERFMDKTVISLTDLCEDLKRARMRGFAFDDEERKMGMRCVAVPILNAHGGGGAPARGLPIEISSRGSYAPRVRWKFSRAPAPPECADGEFVPRIGRAAGDRN